MEMKLIHKPLHDYGFCSNHMRGMVAMVALSFYLLLLGKSENCHLLFCYCRYFHKSFAYIFLEKSWTFIKHAEFGRISDFDRFSMQQRCLIFFLP